MIPEPSNLYHWLLAMVAAKDAEWEDKDYDPAEEAANDYSLARDEEQLKGIL